MGAGDEDAEEEEEDSEEEEDDGAGDGDGTRGEDAEGGLAARRRAMRRRSEACSRLW